MRIGVDVEDLVGIGRPEASFGVGVDQIHASAELPSVAVFEDEEHVKVRQRGKFGGKLHYDRGNVGLEIRQLTHQIQQVVVGRHDEIWLLVSFNVNFLNIFGIKYLNNRNFPMSNVIGGVQSL